MQPSQLNWSFPDFPPVPLLKPEILKLTTILKIEIEISILIEKRYLIFSHAYWGSSRSLHSVATHLKPPGFKLLN